ncbi:MAG: hypothetical protein KF878_09565, partial [Planctomycetes bacterium]|nr:hypothetical protein [Planctomycetota bacterium]
WRRVEAAGEGPAPRYAVAAAYDPRRQAVRFAGGWAREAISEVWAWDGAWSRERSLPAGRYSAGLAANDRQVVFLGGDDVDRRACDDVWVLGGDAGWRRGTRPAGPDFGGRHAVVHAPDRATFLVFGGRPAALWEWAGVDDWRAHGCPVPARAGAAVAYDAARRRLVVFGGEEAPGPYLDELWEWDGRAWAQGAGGPPARTNAMLTFDGARCLLFGGAAARPGSRWEGLDDLWAWDGQVWEALATEGERPGGRARGGFAWDPRRGVGVLFGGVAGSGARPLGDLWELVPP